MDHFLMHGTLEDFVTPFMDEARAKDLVFVQLKGQMRGHVVLWRE